MNKKPKFPPLNHNYVYGGPSCVIGPVCECGSSLKTKWLFFKSKHCIQPNCDNYYKGFPSEEYDPNHASYINGKLDCYYTAR